MIFEDRALLIATSSFLEDAAQAPTEFSLYMLAEALLKKPRCARTTLPLKSLPASMIIDQAMLPSRG